MTLKNRMSMYEGLPYYILGSGGMAGAIFEVIESINEHARQEIYECMGAVTDDNSGNLLGVNVCEGLEIRHTDNWFQRVPLKETMGFVISFGFPEIRKKVAKEYQGLDKTVFPIIVAPDVRYIQKQRIGQIGSGTVIMHGVTMHKTSIIGAGALINKNVSLGHDARIGMFTVVNPGACISGNVTIGDGCLIGANATILQRLVIGDGAIVGAGAVVTKDVQPGVTVMGVPARIKEEVKMLTSTEKLNELTAEEIDAKQLRGLSK